VKATTKQTALKTIAGACHGAAVTGQRHLEAGDGRGPREVRRRKGLVGLGAKALPKVVSGAAEGAVYGLGQSISEAAISDHEWGGRVPGKRGPGGRPGGGIPWGWSCSRAGVKVGGALKRKL